LDRAGLLLIGPIEGDRGRILMKPWGRDGIDLQGIKRDRPKPPVQRRRKQRFEALPQPVSMERGSRQARLEYGYHPAFLQTCPHLIEGMMAIQNRQEQSLDPTATGEDIGRVWRGQKVSISAATLSWRTPPSTNGKWAMGLICGMARAIRPPFDKASERCHPSACHHNGIGVNSA